MPETTETNRMDQAIVDFQSKYKLHPEPSNPYYVRHEAMHVWLGLSPAHRSEEIAAIFEVVLCRGHYSKGSLSQYQTENGELPSLDLVKQYVEQRRYGLTQEYKRVHGSGSAYSVLNDGDIEEYYNLAIEFDALVEEKLGEPFYHKIPEEIGDLDPNIGGEYAEFIAEYEIRAKISRERSVSEIAQR